MFNFFGKKPLEDVAKPNMLFGVDLRKYHYLGRGVCRYVTDVNDPNHKVNGEQFIHFFVNKMDYKDRIYKLVPCGAQNGISFKLHGYVAHNCPIWAAGEHDIFWLVNHEPSDWLRSYMAKDDYVWDDTKNWWIKKSEVKKKPKITKGNNNVVKVDFKSKDEPQTD